MKKILLAATIALIGMSSSASAGFVDTDWKTTGDGLASLHEETGLEWLDFTQTIGLSINGVKSLLDTTYEGWRLPSQAEVNHVMHAITGLATENNGYKFYTGGPYRSQWGTYKSEARAVINTFGGLYSDRNDYRSQALHLNDTDANNVLMSGAFINHQGYVYDDLNRSESLDYSLPIYSVFLVSDGGTTLSSIANPSLNSNNSAAPSAVSAPLALGLMSFGMLAFSRRKNIKGLK
jgi:opacity protein-like surface antigen